MRKGQNHAQRRGRETYQRMRKRSEVAREPREVGAEDLRERRSRQDSRRRTREGRREGRTEGRERRKEREGRESKRRTKGKSNMGQIRPNNDVAGRCGTCVAESDHLYTSPHHQIDRVRLRRIATVRTRIWIMAGVARG